MKVLKQPALEISFKSGKRKQNFHKISGHADQTQKLDKTLELIRSFITVQYHAKTICSSVFLSLGFIITNLGFYINILIPKYLV